MLRTYHSFNIAADTLYSAPPASFVGASLTKDHDLQNALGKMSNSKPKLQSCLACEHGVNVNLGRKHTLDCRPDSLWTVTFDANEKVLKRDVFFFFIHTLMVSTIKDTESSDGL